MSISPDIDGWPSDPEHREAIDTVLEMASAEHRWGEHHRALLLLSRVEQIVGVLPPGYERMRRRCASNTASTVPVSRGVQFQHAVVTPARRSGGRPTRR